MVCRIPKAITRILRTIIRIPNRRTRPCRTVSHILGPIISVLQSTVTEILGRRRPTATGTPHRRRRLTVTGTPRRRRPTATETPGRRRSTVTGIPRRPRPTATETPHRRPRSTVTGTPRHRRSTVTGIPRRPRPTATEAPPRRPHLIQGHRLINVAGQTLGRRQPLIRVRVMTIVHLSVVSWRALPP
jgi:hypothetical protein